MMTGGSWMRLGHLAQRLFNVPLAIHPQKAEIIVAALADRLGVANIHGFEDLPRDDGVDLSHTRAHAAAMFEQDLTHHSPNVSHGYDVLGGVAIVPVYGTLVHRLGTLNPVSGMTGYDGIRQNFLMALTDSSVRAVLLDIDSPGGEVAGAFDLADTIHAARGAKPVWAVLDESAYSAAYAIASAADRISVPRTGGVGSIGVVWMHVDWSKALTSAGLTVTFVAYGERKLDGYPELPLSAEARARAQSDIDAVGELFTATVARNRSLDPGAIRAMQAGTFGGAQGVANGLADAIQAPDEAFRSLVQSLETEP